MRPKNCKIKGCRKWQFKVGIPFCRQCWSEVPTKLKDCIINTWNTRQFGEYHSFLLTAVFTISKKSVDKNNKH